MADRPIIFSAPMITALLEGRKTMTRRVLKLQPEWPMEFSTLHKRQAIFREPNRIYRQDVPLPHAPGDLRWVREAICLWPGHAEYDADGETVTPPNWAAHEWIEEYARATAPSIHMPRWASRLTLEVTDVRVERVQEISLSDCADEGCAWEVGDHSRKESFCRLWDSLNAKRGFGWETNPWVAAISFRAHRANIDQFKRQMEAA